MRGGNEWNMGGLVPARLALVLVKVDQNLHRVGTAYHVTPSLLLTARHVLHGDGGGPPAQKVMVRFLESGELFQVHEQWASGPELDACLLKLPQSRALNDSLCWGKYDRSRPLSWGSSGFPIASKVYLEDEEEFLRDSAQASGELTPLGAYRRKLYELTVKAAPFSAEEWGGLSGAPVFAERCLIALIRSTPTGFSGQRLYATPVARLMEDERFRAAVGAPPLHPVPEPYLETGIATPRRGLQTPSELLRADFRVVPFFEESRRTEWEQLEAWCGESEPPDDSDRLNVRLLLGAGGTGKTRLLIEWCRHLRQSAAEWQAGFLPAVKHGSGGVLSEEHWKELDMLLHGVAPVFITIDGADIRPTLREELQYLQKRQRGGQKVWVLLLARQAGDWLLRLQQALAQGVIPTVSLGPVSMEGALRTRAFAAARQAFADYLERKQVPDEGADLSAPLFERMLFLHMAALAAVEELDYRASVLMDQILMHEQDFWYRSVKSGNELEDELFFPAARRAVAALTLKGGATDEAEAKQTLQAARGPEGCAFLAVLRRLYPGSEGKEGRTSYLSGLEPDLLGEGLVERVFARHEEGRDFLEHVFEGADEDAVKNGFRVLGRLSQRIPETARPWLTRLLAQDVRGRARAALEAALALGKESTSSPVDTFGQVGAVLVEGLRREGTPELAEELEGFIPQHTVSLREVAVWVFEKQLEHLPTAEDEKTRAERARLLNSLGNRLRELGSRVAEARRLAMQAMWLYKELAEQNPKDFFLLFAGSLNNLGAQMAAMKMFWMAVDLAQDAVERFRELDQRNPGNFFIRYALATSLDNLGSGLSTQEKPQEAVEPSREAVRLFRELAEQDPGRVKPELARSLSNHGVVLVRAGNQEEALKVTHEAVKLSRELVQQNAEAHLPRLANSLYNLSNLLSRMEQRQEAVEPAREAVKHFRKLARQNPDDFLSDLAMSLNRLSDRLRHIGQNEQARQFLREAVDPMRDLVQRGSWMASRRDLAWSLARLSIWQGEDGKWEEALSSAQESVDHYRLLNEHALKHDESTDDLSGWASSLRLVMRALENLGRRKEALEPALKSVEHYRELARRKPEEFLPILAEGLTTVGHRLGESGQREQSLGFLREAVTQYRVLAGQRPEEFLPKLAASLNHLHLALVEAGEADERVAILRELVEHYRVLTQRNPEEFLPELAGHLNNLGNELATRRQWEEAGKVIREAVEHYRVLAPKNPETFLSFLSMNLSNLAVCLRQLGRNKEARVRARQAVKHYRVLAQRNPEEFLPGLAFTLHNLGRWLKADGKAEKTLRVLQEEVAIFRVLAELRPADFLFHFIEALTLLGATSSALGRQEESLEAATELVGVYRALAELNPREFRTGLFRSIDTVERLLSAMGRHEEALAWTKEAARLRHSDQQHPEDEAPSPSPS
ncbi:tetratricopeptide repeat protein [Archangium violaceum]|uniref:tetratricopeptide repeat protein n=1 Tax=Archangium violaceum TaxID=83451 RepID=UPI002B29A85C|nr:tetratricopeptide repeat protein [Archangium violaceum]